jgi:UPF0755 protein
VVRRRRRIALAALAAVALAGAGGWVAANAWFHAPLAAVTAPLSVEIGPGDSFGRVAERLAALGVIDSPRLYAFLARRQGGAARIKAGEYEILPGTSPAALLQQFVDGRVRLHAVRIVDGWTFREALDALHALPMLARTVTGPDDPQLMARLGAAGVAPEGEFYPDTYLVPKGTSDFEVLKLAHARLASELDAAWRERRADLPLAGPYELLIMASLVEKETAAAEERPHIAAVFVNRLRRGMRLQTDPTVIYGLGADYDGHIHRRDLQADTPYNTYTRDGLPPTPIALVGTAALRAAAQPSDSEDLYFVATGTGDGHHRFSATLEAHNAAVARYLAQRHEGGGRR